MVHQPSGGRIGQASDIEIHAKEILRVRGELNKIYQRHIGRAGKEIGLDEVERLLDRDYFMGAVEAKERGIVDEILERREGGGKVEEGKKEGGEKEEGGDKK